MLCFLCCLKFIVGICLFICFCQGAALATMVGWLSYGNKKFEALDSQMRTLIPPLRQAMFDFIPMIDADTNAFSGFMVNLNLYYVRALLQVVSLAVLVCTRPLLCPLDGSQKLLCTPDRSCILLSIYEYFRLLFRPFINWRTLFYLHPAQINEKQRDSLIYGSYALVLMIVNANEWKYVTSLTLFFFFDKADSFFPLIFGVQSLRHVEREIKWAMLGILE